MILILYPIDLAKRLDLGKYKTLFFSTQILYFNVKPGNIKLYYNQHT